MAHDNSIWWALGGKPNNTHFPPPCPPCLRGELVCFDIRRIIMDSIIHGLAALNSLRWRGYSLWAPRISGSLRAARRASRFGTVFEQGCQSAQAARTHALACLAGQQAPEPCREHTPDRIHAHRL